MKQGEGQAQGFLMAHDIRAEGSKSLFDLRSVQAARGTSQLLQGFFTTGRRAKAKLLFARIPVVAVVVRRLGVALYVLIVMAVFHGGRKRWY
ncbi:hypothetical protein CH75_08730 [Dyella jiangningensis]|nr:hypothetical protein CH75_08730 [Dyella jiangningensis]